MRSDVHERLGDEVGLRRQHPFPISDTENGDRETTGSAASDDVLWPVTDHPRLFDRDAELLGSPDEAVGGWLERSIASRVNRPERARDPQVLEHERCDGSRLVRDHRTTEPEREHVPSPRQERRMRTRMRSIPIQKERQHPIHVLFRDCDGEDRLERALDERACAVPNHRANGLER